MEDWELAGAATAKGVVVLAQDVQDEPGDQRLLVLDRQARTRPSRPVHRSCTRWRSEGIMATMLLEHCFVNSPLCPNHRLAGSIVTEFIVSSNIQFLRNRQRKHGTYMRSPSSGYVFGSELPLLGRAISHLYRRRHRHRPEAGALGAAMHGASPSYTQPTHARARELMLARGRLVSRWT